MTQNLPNHVFKSATDAFTIGIIITDFLGKDCPIVYANDFFCNLTGYRRDEILGKNCRFLQGPYTDKKVTEKIRNALALQIDFEGEILNYRKDGTTFRNFLKLNPIKDASGKTTHYVGAQHQLPEPFSNKNVDLAKFAATTAHELKNPLSAIVGFATVLQEDHSHLLDDDGRDSLSRIAASASHMTHCLNDLSLFGIIDHTSINLESVGLSDLFSEVKQIFESNPNISYLHFPKNLPEIKCHRNFMLQVFRNLIDNAIKYGMGKERGIYIEVSKQLNSTFEITVSDKGPGVAPEIQSTLFNPFVSTGRASGSGTGLGLTIVRKIIESHKGTIECQTSSKGTTFTIYLPQ